MQYGKYFHLHFTPGKVCQGLGGAASNVHKDIYKACRTSLADRVMAVRVAAADCLVEMLDSAPLVRSTSSPPSLLRMTDMHFLTCARFISQIPRMMKKTEVVLKTLKTIL